MRRSDGAIDPKAQANRVRVAHGDGVLPALRVREGQRPDLDRDPRSRATGRGLSGPGPETAEPMRGPPPRQRRATGRHPCELVV